MKEVKKSLVYCVDVLLTLAVFAVLYKYALGPMTDAFDKNLANNDSPVWALILAIFTIATIVALIFLALTGLTKVFFEYDFEEDFHRQHRRRHKHNKKVKMAKVRQEEYLDDVDDYVREVLQSWGEQPPKHI